MAASAEHSSLFWFQLDLRLDDNPALAAAIAAGLPLIPVYIFDEKAQTPWAPGGASRWWLHHALADLDEQLRQRGSRLIVRHGDTLGILRELCAQAHARSVYASCGTTPALRTLQNNVARALNAEAVATNFSTNASLLLEPANVLNKSGQPFQVFTPYWRTCRERGWEKPQALSPASLRTPANWPASEPLASLELLPRRNWDSEFYKNWTPTREGALSRANHFLRHSLGEYATLRDRPDIDGTSCLSPWLHFGQIGPREVAALLQQRSEATVAGADKFLAELGWREFSFYLLHHNPQMPDTPLKEDYRRFPARASERLLRAWQLGRTGYPIVDAGMRQLWATGWMHNRVRMVAASLLVKHLLQPWQAGARWFWDTLVDADLAANTQGWQWSAGCGADAAPYFRVFNPVTQGERFDPQGEYVRRWLPELSALPARYIHRPWQAPPQVLKDCGLSLGKHYPEPVIGLMEGRIRALNAFAAFKAAAAPDIYPK